MYLLGSGMAQRRVIIRKYMSVLKFINSKDVREYLKKTDYKFNSLEAAWYIENGKENEIYSGVFEGLWFDFPTPFRKGDIVWEPNKPKGLCAGPFVTTGICLDGIASEKVKEHIRKNGDMTDMCARGYFMNEDGSFYKECINLTEL